MAETLPVNHRRHRWPWPLTIRGWLVLISSITIGFFFWIIERDWYWGALAAISLGIIFGLAAQVHDLWRGSKESGAWTSEERWAWRFAVVWRLVVVCLMVASFLVRLLVKWKVLALDPGRDIIPLGLCGMHDAVLLTAMIIAIAGSPRLAKRAKRHGWSSVTELLGGIAMCILCVILLMEQLVIPVLVHITIAGIELAQPLQFSSEALAAYSPARLTWFFDVTTVGVVSVLVSCILLRLLSLWWWRGVRWRVCLSVLLTASLATMIVLSERIAFVEVPDITPALAADISMPRPHQMVTGAVLAMLLVSAAARRWSEPPPIAGDAGNFTWRRDEGRYYHERRILLFPLAGVMLIWLLHTSIKCAWEISWELFRWLLADWIMVPQGCLSLAIVFLVVQSEFSRWSKSSGTTPLHQPQLEPGLFLLIWLVLLAIVVFAVPILGAWGFALWFNLG